MVPGILTTIVRRTIFTGAATRAAIAALCVTSHLRYAERRRRGRRRPRRRFESRAHKALDHGPWGGDSACFAWSARHNRLLTPARDPIVCRAGQRAHPRARPPDLHYLRHRR